MSHLGHEDLILLYYGEPELPEHREHVATCEQCAAELKRLTELLDKVQPADAPDPGDDYEARVWDRLRWRLRAERRTARRGTWIKWTAAAAVLALTFTAGLLWNRTQPATAPRIGNTTIQQAGGAPTVEQRDRILLVFVGEHFDQSERVLVELTNLTASDNIDISAERHRAEELLVSNRIYRSNASERGEESVATLLDELEPVLMQIAHAPDSMTAEELRSIQKRVEARGLVFKLRVVRAGVRATSNVPSQPNV
jgi:hypothetical protein